MLLSRRELISAVTLVAAGSLQNECQRTHGRTAPVQRSRRVQSILFQGRSRKFESRPADSPEGRGRHFFLYLAYLGLLLATTLQSAPASGQDQPFSMPAPANQAANAQPRASAAQVNPWSKRPVCASMFLQADWQLTQKQRACDWLQNGAFSMTGLLAAASAATYSKIAGGDAFLQGSGRNFAKNGFKSTGTYLVTLLSREDPRRAPPYLPFYGPPHPSGFSRRLMHAVIGNLLAYRFDSCTSCPLRRVPAISRVVGAFASGFGGELLESEGRYVSRRALRGAEAGYAGTFVNAVIVEFKPELSTFAGKTVTTLFGSR
jgi:hypothetical protein